MTRNRALKRSSFNSFIRAAAVCPTGRRSDPRKVSTAKRISNYERDGLKGIAVFIDGPSHDEPAQREKDTRERTKLDNMGYRVLVICYDRGLEEQISQCPDIFGTGTGRR